MKVFKALLSICVMSGLWVGSSLAADEPGMHWEVGTEVSYYKYEEPNFMEQEGMMYGIIGSLDYLADEGESALTDFINFYSVEGRFAYGQVDYTSTNTGSLDDIDDFLFEIRGLVGHSFDLNESWSLMPFTGIAYRYLNDDSSGQLTTTGHAGYQRESNYFYIPIGAKLSTDINDEWKFAIQAEFDLFIDGEQKSHLEDVNPANPTLTNNQDDGYGVRGSIEIVRKTDTFNFLIEPYIRYWDIDDSDIAFIGIVGNFAVYGLEPANESLEAGVRIGLQY